FIGDCGITLQHIDGKLEPEIGYHIHYDYTNKGYASEAAIACKEYAFTILKLKQIYSYMKYTNISSQRVAEKCGMKLLKEVKDDINEVTKIYTIINPN
ncbi:MAG: GNAT family N-acetyltransferase; N-acetyltransferase, partial [Coprobacillaceae bacterium]